MNLDRFNYKYPKYWQECEQGFPKRINFKVVAGPNHLNALQISEEVYNKEDVKFYERCFK